MLKSLDEKNKEIFEKYRDCYNELTQLNECEVFKIGFKLGVRMLLDCYDGDYPKFCVKSIQDLQDDI